MEQLLLTDSWQFKQRQPGYELRADFKTDEGWLPANVPGTVQQDLMTADRIPDPFYGLNEREIQWVGESDWLYRTSFDLPANFSSTSTIVLCFDGLDTFATVWLNGQQILVSDNMFVPQRVSVGELLKPVDNELHLLFESALRRGQEREEQYGRRKMWNGDSSRLYVRKAQYHYGWDWGPVLLTAGIWQPIRLEAYNARFSELNFLVTLTGDLKAASLQALVKLEEAPSSGGEVVLTMNDPEGKEIARQVLPATAQVQHDFQISNPRLWWPRGYGDQPLYTMTATLNFDGQMQDQRNLRVGIRQLRLVQEPVENESGRSFYFEVNHTPIFAGGVNWIPGDNLTPRITLERYRQHLQKVIEANMVMVRVWGGGIYEPDEFYDLCDELGILVWQDFMFACGLYPAHVEFQASVRSEAEAVVRRLRHHPSLALWCGNNEDYWLATIEKVYDASFEGDFTTTAFPAREIYERLLPQICTRLDPGRAYWPGSPYGGNDANDQTRGDRHTWDIWHGNLAPYQDYPKYAGRFVSEFGMMAFPVKETVAAFAPPSERYPASRTMDYHNKATEKARGLATYLVDNVRIPAELSDYIYATQFIQSEALVAGVRGWRRQWGKAGRRAIGGALIWQLNDSYPVISWSLIDYYMRLKPAYYTVRRELAPIVVSLADNGQGEAELWAVNGTLESVKAELIVRCWTLDGELVDQKRQPVTLASNQATELGIYPYANSDSYVLEAQLMQSKTKLARSSLWPEPFKYLYLGESTISLELYGDEQLVLRARRPEKGVLLSAPGVIEWNDNMLDLMPGDEYIVRAIGLNNSEITVKSLNQIINRQ